MVKLDAWKNETRRWIVEGTRRHVYKEMSQSFGLGRCFFFSKAIVSPLSPYLESSALDVLMVREARVTEKSRRQASQSAESVKSSHTSIVRILLLSTEGSDRISGPVIRRHGTQCSLVLKRGCIPEVARSYQVRANRPIGRPLHGSVQARLGYIMY